MDEAVHCTISFFEFSGMVWQCKNYVSLINSIKVNLWILESGFCSTGNLPSIIANGGLMTFLVCSGRMIISSWVTFPFEKCLFLMLKNQTWNEIVKLWWIFFSKVKTEMHTCLHCCIKLCCLRPWQGNLHYLLYLLCKLKIWGLILRSLQISRMRNFRI